MDALPVPFAPAAPQPPRLLESLRQRIWVLHYSIRTEQAYVDWARRFILFHGKRHPREMGAPEVMAFLTHLAVERNVSASTQNQAKAAILFLYKDVLQQDLPWLDEVVSAKKARRLPVVLTQRELVVREGKGNRDRVTVLPENLLAPLREQMERARVLHRKDLDAGLGAVWLPDALAVALAARRAGIASPVRRMCCGIPSPPICCKRVTTSAPCRNCWATRMCVPP